MGPGREGRGPGNMEGVPQSPCPKPWGSFGTTAGSGVLDDTSGMECLANILESWGLKTPPPSTSYLVLFLIPTHP